LSDRLAFGGTFSNLLVPYLQKKNSTIYDRDPTTGESGNGRSSLPPPLLSQGQRTQPDWLFQFLLNPTPVRRMTILRMPKFNMSTEEARMLVDYFAGVERLTNPGIGLGYPLAAIPQQGALDNPWWSQRNAEYVERLKTADKNGQTLLAGRLKAYEPIWTKLREEQ